MKFYHLLNKKIFIARMAATSGYKMAISTVTSCWSEIQPLDLEKTSIVGGVFGKTYKIFTDIDVDLQEGDTIRDSNNKYYKVKGGGVTDRSQGSISYQEAIIMETEDD